MNINGYTLKKVKMMETPMGIDFSADIYYNNSKIGMTYNFRKNSGVDIYLYLDNNKHLSILTPDFIEKLFLYDKYEQTFKEYMESCSGKALAFVTYKTSPHIEVIICDTNNIADEIIPFINYIKPEQKIESLEIFRTLDDFNITLDTSQLNPDNDMGMDIM